MVKPLSEQLADLSVKAKEAEDAAAAAKAETAAQIQARRDHARAAATAAIEEVDTTLKGAKDAADGRLEAMRSKVSGDIESLKARIAEHGHERDVRRAEDRAALLEQDAGWAIGYAKAAVEQAKLAVLDAQAARRHADELRTA